MAKANQLKYINEYNKSHYIQYKFKLKVDDDLNAKLNKVINKTELIVNLLNAYFEKQELSNKKSSSSVLTEKSENEIDIKIIEMRKAGLSYKTIVEELHVSKSRIAKLKDKN